MDNPSVALVCHEYPPYHIGGVGSYCRDLSLFLSKRRVPTTVFCGKSKEIKKQQVNEYLTLIRLPFLDIPLRAYWFQVQNYSFLRKKLKDFDVIHAIHPQSSAVSSFINGKNMPLVTTIHGVPRFNAKAFFKSPFFSWTLNEFLFNFFEAPLDETLYKLCFKKSVKIVAVSHNVLRETRKVFHDLANEKVSVIPNGINFQEINDLKSYLNISIKADARQILFYGRLVWVKGIFYLISAIAELRKHFPDIRLKVIGTGPLQKRLHKMVCKLDLGSNVDFLGYRRHHDVLAKIVESSIVVLPSSYEASSIALLEAMALKKPVVAFDYPFTREVIKNFHNGLLAKPGDSNDLAEKIRMLIEDKSLRNKLGVNAFQRVYFEYNWEKLIKAYIDLYREAVECHVKSSVNNLY